MCELLRRSVGSRIHFMQCVAPTSNCVKVLTAPKSTDATPGVVQMDIPHARSQVSGSVYRNNRVPLQMRALSTVDAVRFAKVGYPESMPYAQFCHRYECLVELDQSAKNTAVLDKGRATADLLATLHVDGNAYRMGLSVVFLRSDLYAWLEDGRNARLTGTIVTIQSLCRMYLARRQLSRLTVQRRAVECLQKNIAAFSRVREWPWWRLYTRVLPLIGGPIAARTADATAAVEVNDLRHKCTVLEKQVADYRLQCGKLTASVDAIRSQAAEERQTASAATEALESENTQRTQMAKEMHEWQTRAVAAERRAEKIELELMEMKNMQNAVVSATLRDSESSSEDGDGEFVYYVSNAFGS